MKKTARLPRLLALVASAGALSAMYQAAAEARDRRRLPPPGRLMDVGGRRLHISAQG